MQYLAWRVLSGLNKKIEISFMMVGHTKFAPDWAFGLLKQRFRKSVVGCLDDMVRVVNESASVNVAQLVGSESGNTFVRQYNWSDYFHKFYKRQAFDGIKSFHHLKFDQTRPGKVMVREVSDGEEKELTVLAKPHLHWKPDPNDLPQEIHPPGLSRERRQYLFDKIREFCPEESRDKVCPNPDIAPATSTEEVSTALSLSSPPLSTSLSPPPLSPSNTTNFSPSPSPIPPSKRQCHRHRK